MSGQASLSKEQAYLLGLEIGFDSKQQHYLSLLCDRQKSGVKEHQDFLEKEILRIQNENTQSDDYIDIQKMELIQNLTSEYYLDPYMMLIHLSLSIDKYQRKPKDLQSIFSISDKHFQKILSILERLELIKITKTKVQLVKANLHLPKDSPYFPLWQSSIKLKSNEHCQRVDDPDKYQFVASFTCDEETQNKIRLDFMSFLERTKKHVERSKSKRLCQMNFDLFCWL